MCISLENIISPGCGANAAGATDLYLIKVEHVESIPAPDLDSHTISTDLTMTLISLLPAEWTKVVVTGQTLGIEANLEGEKQHQSWKNSISFEIPKQRDNVLYQLNGWVGMPILVIAIDNNGTPFLLGDLQRPCYLSVGQAMTGKASTDKNHVNATFEVTPNSTHSPYIYNGEINGW